MFTGIVEETGKVEAIKQGAKAVELAVRTQVCGRGLKVGDSLAVNGCCLTVTKISGRGRRKQVCFALLKETWKLTNLSSIRPGAAVNLERALQVGGRLGGHFMTGHIDGMGKITRWERVGKDYALEISASAKLMRYIVLKGSIAVDGISLTVAEVNKHFFRVWIIPHTYEATALHEREIGDAVNLETDLLGKFVERFVTSGRKS